MVGGSGNPSPPPSPATTSQEAGAEDDRTSVPATGHEPTRAADTTGTERERAGTDRGAERPTEFDPFWARVGDSPEHILFGSDYPHPEGMADPLPWAEEIGDLFPSDDVRKMMGGNMYALLGLTPPGG